MRREGRIHGCVFNLDSQCYETAPRKPTNRSKRRTGLCNRPRCRFCRLHPVDKSSSKSKGKHKARGLDITLNHLMDGWTLDRSRVNTSLDSLHLAGIRPFAKWAEMEKDEWNDNGGEEDVRCDDDPLPESHDRLSRSSNFAVGHCNHEVIQQFPSFLCQKDSQVQSGGITATFNRNDACPDHGDSDNESWSEIGTIYSTGDMELDDWIFIADIEEPYT